MAIRPVVSETLQQKISACWWPQMKNPDQQSHFKMAALVYFGPRTVGGSRDAWSILIYVSGL